MSKSCSTCVYFHPLPSAGGQTRGQCRIGPPQPTDSIAASARWPLVWADDWCGCHSPAETATLRVVPREGGPP